MQPQLRPKGMLKEYANGRDRIPVLSGIPLKDAIISSGIPNELVAMAFVDQKPKNKDEIVIDGEIIDLVAVIGGG